MDNVCEQCLMIGQALYTNMTDNNMMDNYYINLFPLLPSWFLSLKMEGNLYTLF